MPESAPVLLVSATSPRPTAASPAAMLCPFHDGAATLDMLLAELAPNESALFDAALDLRSLFLAGEDATACVEQLFRLRELLDSRHYLAFYRVRCWARRTLRIEVRAGRASTWIGRELPLDGGRLDEVINTALAPLAADGTIPPTAHVRFTFVSATPAER